MSHETADEHYGRALRDADVGGLIAAARMYLDAQRLDDAQAALLAAGRLQPREGEIYRWLGEVLLRRGDADRAEKVLEKAVQFGSKSNAIAVLEQARGLIATQHAAGEGAVADLVAQQNAGRGIVYLHGKAGYSRSAAVAGAVLLKADPSQSVEDIVSRLYAIRRGIVVRPEIVECLEAFRSNLTRPGTSR